MEPISIVSISVNVVISTDSTEATRMDTMSSRFIFSADTIAPMAGIEPAVTESGMTTEQVR